MFLTISAWLFLYSSSFKAYWELFLIHSLYFDDYKDTSIYTTNSGLSKRYKWRIRYYDDDLNYIVLEKKEKLNESLKQLAELKDSVEHCQEIIKKNKDRYPILEKNNKLIVRHIAKIQEEIDNCNKSIEYYDKKKK